MLDSKKYKKCLFQTASEKAEYNLFWKNIIQHEFNEIAHSLQ